MKKELLKEIIKKKNNKDEFAIITNLNNGENCIYQKDKQLSKYFEEHKKKIDFYFNKKKKKKKIKIFKKKKKKKIFILKKKKMV